MKNILELYRSADTETKNLVSWLLSMNQDEQKQIIEYAKKNTKDLQTIYKELKNLKI